MDLIDVYLKYTAGHESTERVRKWSFISVLAALLERRVWIERGYYTLYPNLYVFIIGRSGLIKKSTSTGIAVNLLREVPRIKMMSERLTAGSLVTQLGNSWSVFEHEGKKIKQSALFAYASELAVMLQDNRGPITELLTTFYDCIPHDSEKPWVQRTVNGGEVQIFGPCLNILGASTKTWLTKCIPQSEMEGGFTSRIIFVVENQLPPKFVAWPEVASKDIKSELIERMQWIGRNIAGPMSVTETAKSFFSEWYGNHMKYVLPRNMDPRMVGYMSRKGDCILKLAMIKSIASSDMQIILPKHMEWAIDELDAIEPDWRGAFEGLGIKDGLAWDLRNYVRSRGQAPLKEVLDTFSQQYPMSEITREVAELIDMGEFTEVALAADKVFLAYTPES